MLTLHISNGTRVREQISLPMPLEEINRQMEAIRAKGQPGDGFFVSNVDSAVSGLGWHLQYTKLDDESTFQKLNRLAESIDTMGPAGHYHLSKALPADCQLNLDGVLQAAVHVKPGSLENYEIIPNVTTPQELGKWLVEHDRLDERVPESVRPYLHYSDLGLNYCIQNEGIFLLGGYTGIYPGSMERVLEEQSVLHLTLATSERWYYLTLPASEEALERAKRDLDVEDFAQAGISVVKFSAPQLDSMIPLDTICVEDANELALCLKEMEQENGALTKFCAALEVEQPGTFAESLNIAMDRDDYELVPEDMDEYGRQVLRRAGADDEVIDTIDGYMDFAQLGTDSLEEDGVRRTEYGLIRRLSAPFPLQEIGQTMS